jgi:hypothetical protein
MVAEFVIDLPAGLHSIGQPFQCCHMPPNGGVIRRVDAVMAAVANLGAPAIFIHSSISGMEKPCGGPAVASNTELNPEAAS